MSEWMIVYSTNDESDAHIVAGRLKVEGIKSFIQREALGGIFGITYGALGNVNVVVNLADYDRALAIIEPDELYALTDDNDEIVYFEPHLDHDNDAE